MEVEDSVRAYSTVFRAGTDLSAIQATLEKCLTEDAVVVHPEAGVLQGVEAIAGFVRAFHSGSNGASVIATTGVDEHHGRGRFEWAVESADGTRLGHGVDFVEFTGDGRIAAIAIFADR